jgi:hypothetical protein
MKCMQEFYFRGMPYPSHLGVNKGNNKKGKATKTETSLDAITEEAEQEGESDSEEDQNASGKSDSIGDSEDMMNCYLSRPSSAFVITNESLSFGFNQWRFLELPLRTCRCIDNTQWRLVSWMTQKAEGLPWDFPISSNADKISGRMKAQPASKSLNYLRSSPSKEVE